MSLLGYEETFQSSPGEQEARRAIDPWEDELRKYVANKDCVHSSELMRVLIPVSSQTNYHFRRVKTIMTEQLGWKYGQVWINGQNNSGYSKPD